MPCEDPALIAAPITLIQRVRIVRQGQRRLSGIERGKPRREVEFLRPEVSQAEYLQASNVEHLIAQHRDPDLAQRSGDFFLPARLRPVHPVIMIPQNRRRSDPALRKMRENPGHRGIRPLVQCHEIPRIDHDIRFQRRDAIQAFDQEIRRDPRRNMDVADLDEGFALQRIRQFRDGQFPLHKLQEKRLHQRGVSKRSASSE